MPLGYETERVMTAAIFGNFTRVTQQQRPEREHARSSSACARRPASASAAMTDGRAAARQSAGARHDHDRRPRASPERRIDRANGNVASDGYFETLDVPMLAGRDFRGSDDAAQAPRVAIINQSMAKFWDGADPIGSRVHATRVRRAAAARSHRHRRRRRLPAVQRRQRRRGAVLPADAADAVAAAARLLVRTDGPRVGAAAGDQGGGARRRSADSGRRDPDARRGPRTDGSRRRG